MNWMHSCKQVAELLSQRLDEPLGLFDTIRLRVHLSMCDNCRNVEQQLAGVHALSTELLSGGLFGDDGEPALPSGNEGHPSK